jgi:hypothetical protein
MIISTITCERCGRAESYDSRAGESLNTPCIPDDFVYLWRESIAPWGWSRTSFRKLATICLDCVTAAERVELDELEEDAKWAAEAAGVAGRQPV